MTEQSSSNFNPLNFFNQNLLVKQGVSLISGLGIISSGVVLAQTEPTPESLVISTTSEDITPPKVIEKTVVNVNKQPKPAIISDSSQSSGVKPTASLTPTFSRRNRQGNVQLSAPRVTIPTGSLAQKPSTIKKPLPQAKPIIAQNEVIAQETGQNSYIDTTNYNNPTTTTYKPPAAVVLTERTNGCQTVVTGGQLSSGSCGRIEPKPGKVSLERPVVPVALRFANRNTRLTAANFQTTNRNTVNLTEINVNRGNLGKVNLSKTNVRKGTFTTANLSKVGLTATNLNSQGNSFQGNGRVVELSPPPEYSRVTSYVKQLTAESKTALLFPLSLPASISSAFGWRVHPISDTMRMHTGTDIAAATGTPVLAAYGGKVEVADVSGGYGLMVILRHLNDTQESRYAHLSQVFVQPGDWVDQGNVIGLVGSTGNSTGPHLHFEWRHLTASGWVPVDAGLHLEYAMDNLIRSMQMANADPQPQS